MNSLFRPDPASELPQQRAAGQTSETLAEVVRVLSPVPAAPGKPTYQFAFTSFRPGPWWPVDLNAFPILNYESGATQPDGTPANPFLIAVNELDHPDVQVLAAVDYVISIMRRHAATDQARTADTDLSSVMAGIGDLDRLSRNESLALARAVRAGRRDEVVLAVSRWGFGVSAAVVFPWLTRSGYVARIPFFAECYNALPPVRDAVDRIVSGTVGVGPRVAGPSENLRRIVERESGDARTTSFIAHALRDSLLFGAGAVATEHGRGLPEMRLISPRRLVLDEQVPSGTVVEELEDHSKRPARALLLVGPQQPGSSHGSSILEPWAYSLRAILHLRAGALAAGRTLPPLEVRSAAANALADTVALERQVADGFQAELELRLSPIRDTFQAPRYPIYLRSHENWP